MPPRKMYVKMEKIDPETAKTYLAFEKDQQRPVSMHQVAKYAKAMKAGQWKATPEPIAFDTEGNLINGQHRLHAVIESGCTIEFMVAYDCDPDVFDVLDQGKSRSGGDLFTIMYKRRFGESPADNMTISAVAARMLQRVREHSHTKADSAEHAMKHYKLIQRMKGIAKSKIAGSTAVAAAFCNASIYFGEAKIETLADRYTSAMWASASDPLKSLYERIARAKLKESRQHTLSKGEHYAIAVSAIRAALLSVPRPKLMATTRDFGDAKEDKEIRAGKSEVVPTPEPPAEVVA